MLDRILVGLDGLEAAETILQYVRALAQSPAAEVVLLHVATVPGEVLEERHDITVCQLVPPSLIPH